ncbi:hypothetical protein I6A60_20375 [Frankia sp. AgB1.9]|uniref:hypothetical protein n=1 Tax=unclassified Frankia TaxID=2632575 RepID=UPI001931F088|nr:MULTISPECIES: hypothetical protein [unclassified Frankia]MBL7550217.1 hypothetical protein [Frankia sp. AgB1.9]
MDYPQWPPYAPSTAPRGQPQPWPIGQEWHVPRDADHKMIMSAEVRVKNLGSRLAHLTFEGPLHFPSNKPATPQLLLPDSELVLVLDAAGTVDTWAAAWHARENGEPLPEGTEARVICTDDRDTGVVDTWRPRLAAWPIQPVPDRDGLWRLTTEQTGRVEYQAQPPRERVYWLSQRDRVPLPPPVYAEPARPRRVSIRRRSSRRQ